ncbi:MMPL family transporter [Lentzea nigeriaca]|uniref:MMPL family transporter n=1 Tax=Lentzea nigeriaca TaxID=1128665 RepID=UPI00195EB4B6|nr:MMPL family transporter [Lentzea nigeriaca]MBM7856274.1 RND superfamily putative drug exporter [Lentzea nigeriaca]
MLVAWVLVTLAGAMFGGAVFDRTQPVGSLRSTTESAVAQARIDEMSADGEVIVAVLAGRQFNATDLIDNASRVMFDIRAIPGVAEVTDSYTTGAYRVSDDSQKSLVTVKLRPELSKKDALAVADQVAAALRRVEVPELLLGGKLLAERRFGEQAIADAAFGESLALAVLVVVLVVLLGGLAAGSLPLAAALATIAGTLLALTALAGVTPVSEYAVNVVTLLGIGLAVDYSLLIVARFRDERAADRDAPVPELLARTVATAGSAVVVSGLAVGVTLAGLAVFGDPLLAAMAMGGALVVVLATAAGLTLIPALIAVAHQHIPQPGARTWVWRRDRRRGPGVLAGLAAFAQRWPAGVAFGVTAGLLLLSLPVLHLDLGNSDARSLPAGSQERQVAEIVEREFASSNIQPITLVIQAEADGAAVSALLAELNELSGVKDVDRRADLPPGVTIVDVIPRQQTSSERAQQLVRDIRAMNSPVPVLVAGSAAELVDAKDATAGLLPTALLVVIVATALLLFVLTGSVVVPVKALIMNILTLTATLGVMVAIFQWGWASSLLGFDSWGALDLTTPLLLSVFIFGLSMDYEVFLLARIKEEWERRGPGDHQANNRAVLAGIVATGPVVTGGALSIGVVFLGFALGELVAVKEIGVGMAVAVLLDVTVVRGLLLPAVMALLGRRNWWPGTPLATTLPAEVRPARQPHNERTRSSSR